jgi:hypothetical protein
MVGKELHNELSCILFCKTTFYKSRSGEVERTQQIIMLMGSLSLNTFYVFQDFNLGIIKTKGTA